MSTTEHSTPAIVWEEPPPPKTWGNPQVFTDEIAAALRANPGHWALITTGRSGGSTGSYKKTHRDFEWTMRTQTSADGTKSYKIYARFPAGGAA